MKILRLLILGTLSFASICYAQIDTSRMENFLAPDRREFVHSLRVNLAIDDETTILRAHLMRLVLCKIKSNAAEQFCKELKASEDLTGQNVELQDFALSSKNLRLVLEGLTAVYRGAQTYAIGSEAKKQISELLPLMAFAIAKAHNPIEASSYALGEIQKRPEVTKAFSENVDLRVYELFLRHALYWMRGTEPDGRPDPWEIAGSRVVEEQSYGCRIRKSEKFQCWKKRGNSRVDFPMENEEGYRLTIYPQPASELMQFCSEGPGVDGKLHCWFGNPTSDGGFEIEKCLGSYGDLDPNLLFGNAAQWYDHPRVVNAECEKSGKRMLVFMPRKPGTGKPARAITVVSSLPREEVYIFPGSTYRAAQFLNFECSVHYKEVECQPIGKFQAKELHLWVLDSKGVPRDAGTTNLFDGFEYTITGALSVVQIKDGVCATYKGGFNCRHFKIEGDRAIALDYKASGDFSSSMAFRHYGYNAPLYNAAVRNRLRFITWNHIKEGEAYKVQDLIFPFTGNVTEDKSISLLDFWAEEKIICYTSQRNSTDYTYNDPDYVSGANQRCVQLNDKYEMASDVETAIPFNNANARIMQVGRAMCVSGNSQVVCDFPAISKRLFEHPILKIDSRTYFTDTSNGYLCNAEADSAVCYNLNEPGPRESLKTSRFIYKGLVKETMLSRQMVIRTIDAAAEPFMCTAYLYSDETGFYIHTCQGAGNNPKIMQFFETYTDETEPVPATPMRRVKPTPRPKRSRALSVPETMYEFRKYNSRSAGRNPYGLVIYSVKKHGRR